MVQEKELTIRPLEWCEAAGNMLSRAMKSDPLAGIEAIEEMVNAGSAALFGVFSGLYMVACYVLRVDKKPHGSEGVIVAAAGKLKGVNLVRSLLAHVEKQFIGCAAVRIHTARPGLVREMQKAGYKTREVVMAKGL